MAVVKTEELFFNGKKIKRKISCSSKGIFSTTLPEEVVEMFGVPRLVEAESLDKVEREWDLYIGQFTAAQTSERKVIIANFTAEALIEREGEVLFRNGTPGFMHGGIQIEFSAAVYIETTVQITGGDSRKKYNLTKSSIPRTFEFDRDSIWHLSEEYHVIEWTEDREAAFVDLCTKFEDLILRLNEVFKDKEKLLKIITDHQRLLPG